MAKTEDKGKSGPPLDSERAKAIELTVATIEKQFGKGAIMRMGEGSTIPAMEIISSGSIGSTSRSASAGSLGAASSRSTDRSPRARRR
jgi:hypothetical protein